ncbi:MAG: NAD(P)H-dependent oxidoreductase [Bacteroidia bacterium]|nr:NAD(P)H-dependent oxidoreductase [Bacteroidia bacterium]
MKIYLLLGHPDSGSFNAQIAETYAIAAKNKGNEVRMQKLGDLKFDPVLWEGFKTKQELEPDLKQAQENLSWCDHWVIVYPIWWGSFPGLLKGFFDRVLLSGFAFKYKKDSPLWDKLMKGRSAEVITTCDAPTLWIWLMYRNSDLNTIRRAILEFCGFKFKRSTRIGRMRFLDETQRSKILKQISSLVS